MGLDVSSIDGLDLQRKKYFYDKVVRSGIALPKDFPTQDWETLYFRYVNLGIINESDVIPNPSNPVPTIGSKKVFNVVDYGAVGDGVVDEGPAITKAIAAIAANNGGVLYFPPGTYWTRTQTYLTSNMEIVGDNALFTKDTRSVGYVVFAGSSGSTKGYGAGPSNIIAHGLKFKGKFGVGGRALCGFALHHCQDVLVYDCEFAASSAGGHRFDIQGSRRITIRDTVFYGQDNTQDPSTFYNEDIQLDYSTRGGGSFAEPGSGCFDGLGCSDIVVTNNKWLEYTDENGVTYPAGIPLGTHSGVIGMKTQRIWFTDNYVGPGLSDTITNINGRVHFLTWEDAYIKGNVFDGGGKEMSAIHGYSTKRAFDPAELETIDITSKILDVAYMNKNIFVVENIFRNFKCENASNFGVVYMDGNSVTTNYHRNIKVLDNIFEDNKWNDEITINNSQNLIWLSVTEGFTIRGNMAQRQRRAIWVSDCINGKVYDNHVKDSANSVIGLDKSFNVDVYNNFINGLTGTPCIVTNAGGSVRVFDNRIMSDTENCTGIRYSGGAVDGVVYDNYLTGSATTQMDRGVNAMTGSTILVSKDNMFKNVRTKTFADGTSFILDDRDNPPVKRVAPLPTITMAGDSTTLSYGVNWPAKLATHIGVPVVNAGISGQGAADILLRIGAFPVNLTVAGNRIPETGNVDITNVDPATGWRTGTTGEQNWNGRIGGVAGKLYHNMTTDAWYFTRDVAGEAVTVSNTTQFVRKPSDLTPYNRFIISVGRNNVVPNTLNAAFDLMGLVSSVQNTSVNGIVVWGLINGSAETRNTAAYKAIVDYNAKLANKFGTFYYDIRADFISRGLSMAGLTATAADTTAINGDAPPPSLMVDAYHPNPAGYTVIARLMAEFLVKIGWATQVI